MKRTWTINISLPAQSEFSNPSVLTTEKAVKKWLDELPLLRLNLTLKNLLGALSGLNEEKLAYKTRLKILSLYRQVLLKIYPTSELEVLKRLPVKADERNKTREDMGAFCKAMANGYKLVLKQAYEAGENPTDGSNMLTALYHSIEMLVLELINHFRCYRAVEPHLYEEIYLLYRVAEQGNALDTPITLDKVEQTINTIFTRMLILATTDPFHLPQDSALKLYEIIQRYIDYARLYTSEHNDISDRHFIVNLNRDLPPIASFRTLKKDNTGKMLALDKDAMGKKILADITQLQGTEENKPDKETLEQIELLKILLPEEKENKQRKSERKTVSREVKCTFGIEAVFQFLSLGISQLKIVLDSTAGGFDGFMLEPWTIQNESMTGYLLSSPSPSADKIRVGDILAIHNPKIDSISQRGRVAIVKWMQQDANNQTQIGVELIAGNILPVTCRPKDNDPDGRDHYRAVFISSVPALKQAASLITPKKVYYRGRILDVTIGEQPMVIKAGFLVEDSFSFDRFDFSSQEE